MQMENFSKRHDVLVIGVAGGTGSGKTTIAKALLSRLRQQNKSVNADMMTMDSYYKDLQNVPVEERAKVNFDHPSAFETELLVEHIKALRDGKSVDVPVYDYEEHTRIKSEAVQVDAVNVLILEGILLFVDPKLRDLIDIKVYVDASADIRFIRRLQRDVVERGRTVDQVCSQYLSTVRTMHDEFVEPSKEHADIIVPNIQDGDYDVIVDLIATKGNLFALQCNNKKLRI